MNTLVRHLLIAIILMMPVCQLHAQENKYAQAMHTAFVEAIYGKFPKNIEAKLTSFNEDSITVAHGEWGALDGGGLVPKEKIHVVKLSKSRAAVGPEYIDGHKFHFTHVPDDPILPLRPLLDAFDKQARYANSYYSYVAGDEQAAFPGISIAWGEQGQSFSLQLHPLMNVRIIGFKDDDGFRSTYLLTWMSEEEESPEGQHKLYDVNGIIYEFHCPKMKSLPQVKSYDPDEFLDRTNTGMSVAHNLVRGLQKSDPERAAVLETDTVEEKSAYSYQKMVDKVYGRPEASTKNTSHEALIAKVRRMLELMRAETPTEQEAICYTLHKELNAYPFKLSHQHVDEVEGLIDKMSSLVPDELKQQVTSARTLVGTLENPTAEIDSLSEMEQEYLNRNFWKLSHRPVKYQNAASAGDGLEEYGTMFAAQGEHYTADKHKGYLEVRNENCQNFQAENTLRGLRPGRYRLSAVVRAAKAEHSGIYIFCQTGEKTDSQTYQKEIPADGNMGGNVWFSALCRVERKAAANGVVYAIDFNKASVNGGQGFGWNRIFIDNIIVRDGTLTYGVSTRPEMTNSHEFGSRWFSACDFIVERIGD